MLTQCDNPPYMTGDWLYFYDTGILPKGKTHVFEVWTKNNDQTLGEKLGEIRWFGRWRKYSFFPASGTLYEEACLQDITDYLKLQNKIHREKRNAANVSVPR